MKKYILIILIIILIITLILGCTDKNNYKITIYRESEVFKLLDEDSQKTLDFLNERYVVDKVYYTKEIIGYTDKSIRFIDGKNKEIFISADKINVEIMK